MFPIPIPTLYLKLAGLAVIALLVAGVTWHIHHLKSELLESQAKVTELTSKFQRSQDDLKSVTDDRNEVNTKLAQAETQRQQIQLDLANSLKKLRAQKPPVECKAAVDWSVENKDDLDWSKK